MPFQWQRKLQEDPPKGGSFSYEDGSAPAGLLRLWAHQSLSPKGFVVFVGITAGLLCVPLIPLIGTPVLWGLLPFMLLAITALWWGLKRSWHDRSVSEELRLWSDRIELVRCNPRGPDQVWEANPYWVTVAIHPSKGPVPNYVTLSGNGREVEIGAFLSEDERQDLYADLQDTLRGLR
ncbi:MAG: DUF2244 domain-containing protein [Pseudomonadota bacterium]